MRTAKHGSSVFGGMILVIGLLVIAVLGAAEPGSRVPVSLVSGPAGIVVEGVPHYP